MLYLRNFNNVFLVFKLLSYSTDIFLKLLKFYVIKNFCQKSIFKLLFKNFLTVFLCVLLSKKENCYLFSLKLL